MRFYDAEQLSPATAKSAYYDGATSAVTYNWSTTKPYEITATAAALENDPQKIFAFVKNHVRYEPRFGAQKGALGAIIDRSGTAFDQAQLLVELLRAAGVTASYQVGTLTLTGAQFNDWIGLTDAVAARQFLANGGIPATVTGSTTISSVEMGHAWVVATIGGTPVTLDPSYKVMDRWAQIDVATDAGLSPSSFVSTATTATGSGTESGVAYITGVNLTGAKSQLDTAAATLLTKLKTTYKDKRSEEIMGGERIRRYDDPWVSKTTGTLSASWGVHTGGLPDKYRTKLTVEAQQCKVELFVDEIYGRRLVWRTPNEYETGPPSQGASQGATGFMLQGGLPPGTGGNATYPNCFNTPTPGDAIRISADLPYAARQGGAGAYGAWMDRVSLKEIDTSSDAVIVHGWGDTSNELQTRLNDDTDYKEQVRPGSLDGMPPLTGDQEYWGPPYGKAATQLQKLKARLYAGWLAQMTRATDIVEGASNTRIQHQYTIGVAYTQRQRQVHDQNNNQLHDPGEPLIAGSNMDESIRLDIDSGFSMISLAGVAADKIAARHTIAAFGAMLEGSLFEQQQDAVHTISTAQRFPFGQENFASTIRYHRLLPGSSVVAQYREGVTSTRGVACTGQATANQNYTVIQANERFLGPSSVVGYRGLSHMVPYTRRAAQGDYYMNRGCAWVAFNGDASEIAHIVTAIDRPLKGGGAPAGPDEKKRKAPMQADLLKDEFKDRSNLEGVDLRTGAYTYRPAPDLVVGQGEFPYSLSFQRIYQSGGESCPKCLRGGWTHNLDIRATASGGGLEGLGQTTPQALAVPLVAIKAAFEIYKADAQSASNQAAGLGVMRWLSKFLSNNVVTVRQGADAETFVRVADGTLAATPSSQSKLVQIGQRRSVERTDYSHNAVWVYDNVSYALTRGAGDQISFGWKAYNPEGRRSATDGNDYDDVLAVEQGFFASSWTFPQGVTLTFTYCTDPNVEYGGFGNPLIVSLFSACGDKLKRVSSNLGIWIDVNRLDAASSDGRSTTVTEEFLRNPDNSYRLWFPVAKGFVDAAGKTWTYKWEYDDTGRPSPWPRLKSVTEPDKVTPQFDLSYDKLGRVRTWRDADSLAVGCGGPAYTYLAPGFGFGARKDPLNGVVRIDYDTDDRAVGQTDEMGRLTRTEYDARGRVKARVLPWLERQEFSYDDRNNVTEKRRISYGAPNPTWAQTIVLKAQYHATWNKPIKVIMPATLDDPVEREYDYSYNAQGLVNQVLAPTVYDATTGGTSRPSWTMTYDGYGRPLTATDPTGRKVTTAYGQSSQPAFCRTSVIQASQSGGLNLTSTFTCNTRGDEISATDPRGNTSTTSYDALRRKTEVNGPAGTNIRTQWVYDAASRMLEEKKWDAAAGLWRTSTTGYSPAGRARTVTDASGDMSRTCYDAAGRESIKVDPEGRATKTVFNAAGEPTVIERWWRESATACVLTAELPAGQTTHAWRSYAYLANGLVASESDARGNATSFQYDGLARKITTTYPDPDGAGALLAPLEATVYDERDQLKQVMHRIHAGDSKWTTLFYDQLGRVTHHWERDDSADAWPKGRVTRTSYDLAGRKVWSDVSQQATGGVFDGAPLRDGRYYVYDAAGRVTLDRVQPHHGLTTSLQFDYTYGYDAAGNRTSIQWPDGWTATYSFDAANRMSGVSFTGGSGTWAYDSQSRPTGFTRSNGTSTTYAYEPDSDLSGLTHNFAVGSLTPVTMTYHRDRAGLIVYRGNPASYDWTPSLAYARSYGAANALNQVASEAGAGLVFDGRGNMTSDGTTTFTYDLRNRLRTAAKSGMAASYDYDGDDRRTKKTVNGVVTRVIWSGDAELAEADGAGVILRRYVPGPAVDMPLASVDAAGVVTWIHADGQGSIINTSTSAGLAGTPVTYSPYGELGGSLPAGVPFGYTGRYHDVETGLWFYRARYYNPRLGQFMQVDPIGTKDDPNLYGYVAADPVNNFDPSGMICGTRINVEDGSICSGDNNYGMVSYFGDGGGGGGNSDSSKGGLGPPLGSYIFGQEKNGLSPFANDLGPILSDALPDISIGMQEDALAAVESRARGREEDQGRQILIHYTNPASAALIAATGTIRSGARGTVYVTPAAMGAERANDMLFIGLRTPMAGSSVVVMSAPRSMPLAPDPSVPMGLIHPGSIRNRGEVKFLYVGPNPF